MRRFKIEDLKKWLVDNKYFIETKYAFVDDDNVTV